MQFSTLRLNPQSFQIIQLLQPDSYSKPMIFFFCLHYYDCLLTLILCIQSPLSGQRSHILYDYTIPYYTIYLYLYAQIWSCLFCFSPLSYLPLPAGNHLMTRLIFGKREKCLIICKRTYKVLYDLVPASPCCLMRCSPYYDLYYLSVGLELPVYPST